ncbi:MAG TPA: hypothetical protein VFR46_00185 [Actinomycetes bacterium]|nr:hypothetical protein [Actinomycetes bacterium]
MQPRSSTSWASTGHVLGFSWGARLGFAIGEHAPARGWWQSAMAEGAISSDLSAWRVPCLIYMAAGEDMAANAERAAREIPTATFLALGGNSHLSAPYECDRVLPAVRDVFASADMAA